jgi:plastocyanin
MKRLLPLLPVGVLLAGLIAFPIAGAARTHSTSPPSVPTTHTVFVGWGDKDGAAMMFTPKWIDIYVGDTVTWRWTSNLEPHTVSFGPAAMIKKLADAMNAPMVSSSGAPVVGAPPQVAYPTMGHTYNGMGYANSGASYKGTWSLTFTRPGMYKYYCIIHYPYMMGMVVVHPRPMGKPYIVQAGDGEAAGNDQSNMTESTQFFPRTLTIHVGDTVTWIGGFHTVTFGPVALRDQLEMQRIASVQLKNGRTVLAINPKISLPSGGATYDGTGFVNSGILFLRAGPNSKVPPSYSLTFTKAGTYEYDCLLHPGMDGSITVLPAGA